MIIYWSVITFSITEGQIVKMHFGIFSSKLTCDRVTVTSHPGVCTFTRKSQKDQFFLRCVWRLGNRKHTARDSADGDVSSPQRTSHLWLVSAERLRAAAKFSHAANYHCTIIVHNTSSLQLPARTETVSIFPLLFTSTWWHVLKYRIKYYSSSRIQKSPDTSQLQLISMLQSISIIQVILVSPFIAHTMRLS